MALAAIIRRRKRWVIVVAGICVVLVGLLAIEDATFRSYSDPATRTINSFMTAIQQKRPRDAYKMLMLPPGAMSEDGFAASRLANYQIIEWESIVVPTSYTWACGDIHTPDGWIPFEIFFQNHGDSWVIVNFRYGGYIGNEPSNQNGKCSYYGQR
jgi:hypothetical protein